MSAAQDVPPPAGELDRFEAQRQAFSRLMARFTADRDAMIAAVQQCNERIDSLAHRLERGDVAPGASGGEGPGGGGDIEALGERLVAQQQTALSEVRTASDRALQRADEAMRRWREIAEQVGEKDAGLDSVRQTMEKVSERLGRLEELFMAHAAEVPPTVDDTATRALAERLGSIEEQVRGLDDSLDAVRHQVERPPTPPDPSGGQLLDLGLRDLREQVTQLESIAAWTPKLQRLWVSLVACAVFAGFAVVYVH